MDIDGYYCAINFVEIRLSALSPALYLWARQFYGCDGLARNKVQNYRFEGVIYKEIQHL